VLVTVRVPQAERLASVASARARGMPVRSTVDMTGISLQNEQSRLDSSFL
jgi:hypothetical protein